MEVNNEADAVSINIKEITQMLSKLPTSESDPDCCIFKVHNQLREINNKAYEPKIIAIGPYHHGKPNLQMMEDYKSRFLHQQKQVNVEKYVLAMSELEPKARKCYAQPPNLTPNEFVAMMVKDGLFIIELFRMVENTFRMDWIVTNLKRDLLLFENQLPLFVLRKLFEIHPPNADDKRTFAELAISFFKNDLPSPVDTQNEPHNEIINHLLGLVHGYWVPPKLYESRSTESINVINSATKLKEAGVKFKKIECDHQNACSLFDIKFQNGVMQIPKFIIEDSTEALFRNMVAYEQYSPETEGRTEALFRNMVAYEQYSPETEGSTEALFRNMVAYEGHGSKVKLNLVTDYLTFLDCLIDSPEDVEILIKCGIIVNLLGDREVISAMINKITDSLTVPDHGHFYYAEIFDEVNAHCRKPLNKWMANLRKTHLSNPWAIISLLAAFILLMLTIAQTVLAVIK